MSLLTFFQGEKVLKSAFFMALFWEVLILNNHFSSNSDFMLKVQVILNFGSRSGSFFDFTFFIKNDFATKTEKSSSLWKMEFSACFIPSALACLKRFWKGAID